MSKDKEDEVVESREVEVHLTMKMENMTILCKKNANPNGKGR